MNIFNLFKRKQTYYGKKLIPVKEYGQVVYWLVAPKRQFKTVRSL